MAITIAQDSFATRSVTGSWGTGSDGEVWGTPFSNVRAVVGVASGEGSVYCTTPSSYASYEVLYGAYTAQLRDVNYLIRFQLNDLANGPEIHFYARYIDGNNWYRMKVTSVALYFEKNVAGVFTSSNVASIAVSAGIYYKCRFTLNKSALTSSVWSAGGSEPGTPTWSGSDSAITQPGQWGVGIIATGTTLLTGVLIDSFLIATMNAPTTFYVDPTGNDGTGTGAIGSPFATLQFAMNSAVPGTTIIVNNGTYTAPNTMSHINYVSGIASARITIQTATPYGALLRSTNVFACVVNYGFYVDWSGFDISTDSAGRIGWLSYGGFSRIFASRAHDILGVGNYPSGGAGFTTSPNFGGTNNSVNGCKAYNISSLANDSHGLMHGIYIACPNDSVLNCLVWNVTGFGIQGYHQSISVTISNNEVWAYGQGGIVLGIDELVGGMILDNCIVSNNIVRDAPNSVGTTGGTVYAIRESTPSGGSTVGYNNVYSNNCLWNYGATPSFLYHASLVNTLFANPQQVNFRVDGTGDYHASPTSPCINAGTSLGAPATDFDGNARPITFLYDIGPYEYIPVVFIAGGGIGAESLFLFKKQVVRVFNGSGTFLGIWNDAPLLSGVKFTINSGITPLVVPLPRKFDAFDAPGQPGSKGTVAIGNRVEYWIYGPGLPQAGLLKYAGIIEKLEPSIDASTGAESVGVTIMPYSSVLGDRSIVAAQAFGTPGSAGTYVDPISMFNYFFNTVDSTTGTGKTFTDPLILDPANPASSIMLTQYTFQTQTLEAAFEKVRLMLPPNWFWRVNLNKTVTLNVAPTTPQHIFLLGQHLSNVSYSQDVTNLKNQVLVQGKGTILGNKKGSDLALYGQRLAGKSDNRITDLATANVVAQGYLNIYDQIVLRAPIRIFDYRGDNNTGLGYDIETLQVGDTIEILDTSGANTGTQWGQFVWGQAGWGFSAGAIFNQVVTIHELTYFWDYCEISIGSARPNQSKALYNELRQLADFTLLNG